MRPDSCPPRPSATPPVEGTFLPKADPPVAERNLRTKVYDPLLGGCPTGGVGRIVSVTVQYQKFYLTPYCTFRVLL